MDPVSKAMLISAVAVLLSLGSAFGLYKLISPKERASSGVTLGRRWMAWMVAIGTVTTLPRFFSELSIEALATWILCVVFYGGMAFAIGSAIGYFSFKSNNTRITANTATASVKRLTPTTQERSPTPRTSNHKKTTQISTAPTTATNISTGMIHQRFLEWQFQNELDDTWWVAIAGHSSNRHYSLIEVKALKESSPDSNISILHAVYTEDPNAKWLDYELATQ